MRINSAAVNTGYKSDSNRQRTDICQLVEHIKASSHLVLYFEPSSCDVMFSELVVPNSIQLNNYNNIEFQIKNCSKIIIIEDTNGY